MTALDYLYLHVSYSFFLVRFGRIFWVDLVEPKYPWQDRMSPICHQSVPKMIQLDMYWTQIRPRDYDIIITIIIWSVP